MDSTTPVHWKPKRQKVVREATPADFSDGHHRAFYGRPWAIGEFQAAALFRLGVQPHHRVLDLGCGAGRVGAPLLRRLNPGCYVGVEAHLGSLIAFAGCEITRGEAEEKRPVLVHDADFAIELFGPFDVVLDLAVSAWLKPPVATRLFTVAAETAGPGARLFATLPPPLNDDEIGAAGWAMERTDHIDYSPELSDDWRVYRPSERTESGSLPSVSRGADVDVRRIPGELARRAGLR